MKHTKEQLEQALERAESMLNWIERNSSLMTAETGDLQAYKTIQSLIQDTLDNVSKKQENLNISSQCVDCVNKWNYNMDEAPRDGTKCLFLTPVPEKGSPAYNNNEGRVFSGRWQDGWYLEGAFTRHPTAWQHLPAVSEDGVASKITKENEK